MQAVFALEKVVDFFLPSECFLCHEMAYGNNICAQCENSVSFIEPPYSEDIRSSLISKHRSLALYQGEWKKLILAYKSYKNFYLVKDFLRLIRQKYVDIDFRDYDFILGIPRSAERNVKCRFNQSEFLAENIAKHFKRKFMKNALVKVKDTQSQSELNLQQRRENLKNAFYISPKYVDIFFNKKLLLVDDVKTTGSTLNECACLLQ